VRKPNRESGDSDLAENSGAAPAAVSLNMNETIVPLLQFA
jgi:hypothetical protein